MLIDTSTSRSGTQTRPTAASGRRHDDAPDTAEYFARLATLENGPERDLLRDELVAAWLPMAHRIAGRFRDRGESVEDLRQVAALGLVKAIDRFDPERGAFESYAVPTITGEVKRHFRDRMWALRVPRRVQELRNKVRVARRELTQTPGTPEPTVADLAAHTGLTEDEVSAGIEALESFSTLSLDAELGRRGRLQPRRHARCLRHLVRRRDRPRVRQGRTAPAARTRARHPLHALLRGHDAEPDRRPARHLADARLPPHQPQLRPCACRGAGRPEGCRRQAVA